MNNLKYSAIPCIGDITKEVKKGHIHLIRTPKEWMSLEEAKKRFRELLISKNHNICPECKKMKENY